MMILTTEQQEEIRILVEDYCNSINEVDKVNVKKSDSYLYIEIYPKYSLVLTMKNLEEFYQILDSKKINLKSSVKYMIMDFDVMKKCLILAFDLI